MPLFRFSLLVLVMRSISRSLYSVLMKYIRPNLLEETKRAFVRDSVDLDEFDVHEIGIH